MIANGLAVPNTDKTDEFGAGGSSAETAPDITLQFDLSDPSANENQLRTLDMATGKVRHVKLEYVSGTTHETRVRIGGGLGELFWWEL